MTCNCQSAYIKFAKVRPTAKIPSKNPANSGYDIYGDIDRDYYINPYTTRLIPTGLISEFPENWTFLIEERGSTGSKGIKRSAGVIDSNFRGEWFVALTNCTYKTIVLSIDPEKTKEYLLKYRDKNFKEKFGTEYDPEKANIEKHVEKNFIIYPVTKAIAQGLFLYTPHVEVQEVSVSELTNTDRGDGMLGSTGK